MNDIHARLRELEARLSDIDYRTTRATQNGSMIAQRTQLFAQGGFFGRNSGTGIIVCGDFNVPETVYLFNSGTGEHVTLDYDPDHNWWFGERPTVTQPAGYFLTGVGDPSDTWVLEIEASGGAGSIGMSQACDPWQLTGSGITISADPI